MIKAVHVPMFLLLSFFVVHLVVLLLPNFSFIVKLKSGKYLNLNDFYDLDLQVEAE